jgi:hypothetical protein
MNHHWASEQARQRIADLQRDAAGTELLRAARFEQEGANPTERRRRERRLDSVRGTLGRARASLAAIRPWSRGVRRG